MDDDQAAAESRHETEGLGQTSTNQAAAQRDALLDLLGILAHDLSNPLQSLTVLCELGIDDSAPGSEEQTRFRQCLEASDRMRGLIHGFGALTRRGGARTTLHTIVGHVETLLARRFERHRMTFATDLETHGDQFVPTDFELAILALLMGVIAGAERSSQEGCRCRVETSLSEERIHVHVAASDDEGRSIELPPSHRARVAAAVVGTSILFSETDGRATLTFPSGGAR